MHVHTFNIKDNFQLFQDAKLEELNGLNLPETVQCAQTDRTNLKTLLDLL